MSVETDKEWSHRVLVVLRRRRSRCRQVTGYSSTSRSTWSSPSCCCHVRRYLPPRRLAQLPTLTGRRLPRSTSFLSDPPRHASHDFTYWVQMTLSLGVLSHQLYHRQTARNATTDAVLDARPSFCQSVCPFIRPWDWSQPVDTQRPVASTAAAGEYFIWRHWQRASSAVKSEAVVIVVMMVVLALLQTQDRTLRDRGAARWRATLLATQWQSASLLML